jgi:hypothetical protein
VAGRGAGIHGADPHAVEGLSLPVSRHTKPASTTLWRSVARHSPKNM